MKKILAALAALVIAATVAFAHPVPINPEQREGYACDKTGGKVIIVWVCGRDSMGSPDPRQLNRLWWFMERTYKMDYPLETTINLVNPGVLSEGLRGAYFPTTGHIIVRKRSDQYMQAYVMAHELLHAYWHKAEPNTPLGEHHDRIYCLDQMKPVEDYFQKASPRHRVYISDTIRALMCGPELQRTR